MAERLAGGNLALALLANSIATGAALVVLVTTLGPISGAHLNPAVTLVFALKREIGAATALAYVCAQIAGASAGVWAAHLMFSEPVLQLSAKARDGAGLAASEAIATFGLIFAILGSLRYAAATTPIVIALYISAAYWFTASTAFANPAATLARTLTDSFAGVAPHSAPMFIVAQILAAVLAWRFCEWLFQAGEPQ